MPHYMKNEPDALVALEAMIDRHGCADLLSNIATICFGKAEHLRANWQDDATARAWDKAAKVIDRASGHNAVLNITY